MKTITLSAALILAVTSTALTAAPGTTDNPTLKLIHTLGCKGCHVIDGDGGSLAPELTDIGTRMTAEQIRALLIADPESRKGGFMPSYATLPDEDLQAISRYLHDLH